MTTKKIISKTLVCLFSVIVLSGCAATTIETPFGFYKSTRDSTLEGLKVEVIRNADGSEHTTLSIDKAGGRASSVVDAQTALLEAAIELGKKIAGTP